MSPRVPGGGEGALYGQYTGLPAVDPSPPLAFGASYDGNDDDPTGMNRAFRCAVLTWLIAAGPGTARAQTTDPPAPHQHDHGAPGSSAWHYMQDGVVFLTFNHQGGSRGGDELGSENWWMGMARRSVGGGTLTLTLMLSLEPATIGSDGYREIFQAGEALNDIPLIDRQHPHDFLMQAAAVWRRPVRRGYAITLAGAPVGEPALGPVAFMHRSSAFENPTAPLGHHTTDSTHIAMGVLTAGVDRGPWQVESSIFRGREPDDRRWNLWDHGPLDSWSVRGWYRPAPAWTFQVSQGLLHDPEELETGDVRRVTASASWMRPHATGTTATTFLYGRNYKVGADFTSWIAESTHTFGVNAVYGRLEALQVESDLLRFGVHAFLGRKKAHVPDDSGRVDMVKALTLGGVRTVGKWAGWDVGTGGDLIFYGVPTALRPTHGDHPVSFHLFVRVRPPAPMGRMVDVTMTSGGR